MSLASTARTFDSKSYIGQMGGWSGHMYRDWISLLIFFGICFAVGASGSALTASSVKTWYHGLLKPTGTPPPWVFGPVWSILYLLMATAAWLVWRQRIHENVWLALALFMVQLILNGLWSFVFFGLREARSGTGRNHRFVGRHRRDCHAIRGIFTPGILADDTLRRLGALCFLPELRNLAPK
jgi:TspO/MBR family